MKKIFFLSLFILLSVLLWSQMTTTIKLNPTNGKDVYVWDYQPGASSTNSQELSVCAWTYLGTPTIRRVLIRFNISSIVQGATVYNAQLKLFNYPNAQSTWGEHSQLSGTNEFYINRITSPWDEISACWNNQPSVTVTNQVLVPPSTDPHQDYVIDVTQLVQDIVDLGQSLNYGLRLKLTTESYYRSLIFASSENADTTLAPELIVVWSKDTFEGVSEVNNYELCVFPTPAKDFIHISFANINKNIKTIMFNSGLCKVREFYCSQNEDVDISDLAPGIYFLQLYFDNSVLTKRIVIIR